MLPPAPATVLLFLFNMAETLDDEPESLPSFARNNQISLSSAREVARSAIAVRATPAPDP
jgi:hypothetical protein